MKRKFRIKFIREGQSATYILEASDGGNIEQVKTSGDVEAFAFGDGSQIGFSGASLDDLAQKVKDLSEKCGAEYTLDELTGKREFQIKLEGSDFRAEYIVNYTEGNPMPLVTTPLSDQLVPLPDGSSIPFDRINAADLQSFVASMAKSNGLNFEFVDLHE